MFPSHTIELTKKTKDEKPVQKMKRHVPAFQLRASVRCQVRGTEAEVKAKREKTVNAWLTAGILETGAGIWMGSDGDRDTGRIQQGDSGGSYSSYPREQKRGGGGRGCLARRRLLL